MAVQALVLLLVQQLVSLASFVIFIKLLDHGDREHKDKRSQVRNQETYTERLYKLGEANEEEEQVEEVFELVEQHDREEREE